MLNNKALEGMQAPPFKLQNQFEKWVQLGDLFKDGRALLLVFYPGDFTPVCTQQLCAYQDSFDQFEKYNLNIAGISANTPAEHLLFTNRYSFTFDLLSDPDKKIHKEYAVTSLFLLGGTSRAVFIIDTSGRIAYRYVEPTPLTHRKPGELIHVIERLKGARKL